MRPATFATYRLDAILKRAAAVTENDFPTTFTKGWVWPSGVAFMAVFFPLGALQAALLSPIPRAGIAVSLFLPLALLAFHEFAYRLIVLKDRIVEKGFKQRVTLFSDVQGFNVEPAKGGVIAAMYLVTGAPRSFDSASIVGFERLVSLLDYGIKAHRYKPAAT